MTLFQILPSADFETKINDVIVGARLLSHYFRQLKLRPMNQRSQSRALLHYSGTSFGWLIFMTLWILVIGPNADPRCNTSASFGFLPMAMVVPFLMLPLYAISVAIHAVFAFSKKRFDARKQSGVPLIGVDAVFFVPFTMVSLIAYSPATQWNTSLHCFFMTCAIVLPWIITPVVNARLLGCKN